MTDYKKTWKTIVDILSATMDHSKEIKYHNNIVKVFTDPDYLGWPESQVVSEYPVQMGSTKKCDIVLLDKDIQTPLIAIEVKLSTSPSDGVEQLGSYMDRCNPRLKFGMLVKDSINIFYDEETGRNIKSLADSIFKVPFIPDNLKGEEFVKLFLYENFSIDKIQDFCERQKKFIEQKLHRQNKILNIKKKLADINILKQAISLYLKNQGVIEDGEEDILKEVLDGFSMKTIPQMDDNNLKKMVAQSYSNNGIEKIFIPTREDFVARLNQEHFGYLYYFFTDGTFEKRKWNTRDEITVKTVNGNITSKNYYKKNKDRIKRIIICHIEDVNQLP